MGVSMYTFYGNCYVYLCVYIVMSYYLCVYIPRVIIFNKLWLYIFTVCLKSAKRFIRIYTNGWLYIFTVCLKTAKRLIIIYLLAWYLFLELKIVKNGYYGNRALFFAWNLGVIFFRHTDSLRFKISKNIFFYI